MIGKKLRKGEQSVLHGTCRLDIIHIAMKFHEIFHMVTELRCVQG